MAPPASSRSAIMCVPYEIQSMIFAALSDDPAAIIALAKTCTQFYDVYRNDKKARFKYATEITKNTVGFYSPTIVRLGIMLIKFSSCLGRQPGFQDYIIYCPQYWEFSASDFEIVRSGEFEEVIRKAYQEARSTKEAKKLLNGNQQRTSRGGSVKASKKPTKASVGTRGLEIWMTCVFWKSWGRCLQPRVNYFDFFCHCGPGFKSCVADMKDPLGTVLRAMSWYGSDFRRMLFE